MEERAVSWLSMPTEIQQQVYRCLFESVNIIVWLSPQPYTTPMGRGVKTVTNFPQDNSYFAPLLVCRKMYENARKFKRYAALTIEAREYTHSPHLEHLRRAIREQPQISRLFRDCTRIVLWGGDGEFFSRLRHDLPSLQTLRLANIEVDSPLSQIAPRLAFESLEELSTFLTGSWTVHDNEKLAEYEELLRPKGALAAAACLEAFTGQDFAHTASNVVSLDGLTVEVVIFRAEYYSITGTEGEALLTSITANSDSFTLPIARRADDWLRRMPPEDLRAHISRKALTELTLKRRVTATEAWSAWTQSNKSADLVEQAGLVDTNAVWISRAASVPGFDGIV